MNRTSTIKYSQVIEIFLVLGTLFILGATAFVLLVRAVSERASADTAPVVDAASLAAPSSASGGDTTATFSLYNGNGYLYKSQSDGLSAAIDFINREPVLADSNVQGAFSGTALISPFKKRKKLVPSRFIYNSYLVRRRIDTDDRSSLARSAKLNSEHYYFNQRVQGIPVYKANLAVHVRNANEIYALTGNLVISQDVATEYVKEPDAKEFARKAAQLENAGLEMEVTSTEKNIYNGKILGVTEDTTNYPALLVTVKNKGQLVTFLKRYVVSLESGQILFTEDLIKHALDRGVYSCPNGSTTCTLSRAEGESATNDKDVDNTYTYLGDSYNFYKNTYQRDSFDNAGSPLDAFTHLTTQIQCPNAFWSKAPGNVFMICENMAGKDVLVHEFTHGITENTAGLVSKDQSGALDEGTSDIAAYAVDTANWTIGEGTQIGILRHGDDPTKDSPANPDRLFSSNYYCGTEDQGGVHENMEVMVKGFYLMAAGGSFNGCSITGVTLAKAHAIYFRAVTTYMNSTSNFRSAYNGILQACGDLFQSSSDTCAQVTKALQAVELDQQPEGTQKSPVCSNQSPARPACATGSATPTPTKPSTLPTNTPTRTPTISGQPTATPTSVSPTSTPAASPTVRPSSTPTNAPTATPTRRPTATPTLAITPGAHDAVVRLKLRFQGVFHAPTTGHDSAAVSIGIRPEGNPEPVFRSVTVTADSNGIWSGTVIFQNVVPGLSYVVYVKGPKHIQKKICEARPIETVEGTYHCAKEGSIVLKNGDNDLDFSGIYQLAGDLPPQDGLANSYDISLARSYFGRSDDVALEDADVNYDGIVDTQDYSLLFHALSFRYDE